MSKYYLIRDKKSGLYRLKGREWTKDIELATRYKSKKLAENSITNSYLTLMDCEVVELPSREELFAKLKVKLAESNDNVKLLAETRVAMCDTIKDLETKLAESEKKYEDRKRFCINETRSQMEIINNLLEENEQLKQQLRENIVLLEGLRKFEEEKKDMARKRVYELKQQLAEKEKEITKLKSDNHTLISENAYLEADVFELNCLKNQASQAKTDFAIEQLEKVKERIQEDFDYDDLMYWLNKQIKELKEKIRGRL